MPKTPLHERLRQAGRLISESVGDQFVFTNVIPKAMSRLEFYEGYRNLLERLYDYRNYKRRTLDYILSRGKQVAGSVSFSRADVAMLYRILRDCVLKASPRRAWMSVSLLLQTALRRPVAFREAAFFVLVHKHFYEYARHVNESIDLLIAQMKEFPDDLAVMQPSLLSEKILR